MAVVRLSGPGAFAALRALAPELTPRPRFAHRVRLIDPGDGTPIDDGLALTFPGPASFTGDDVVELHLHGSPAVVERLFVVLGRLGAAAAGPGAFTRRAFANGKMDLTAAEGLADLIEADSDSQRIQALAQMGGAWARRIADWQDRLLDALAWLEAAIDFTDEDDVPEDVAGRAAGPLAAIAGEMAALLADGRRGEIIRDGLRVAIVGPPNAGKSTLLNLLVGREAAIVSDIPGTTRDIVEVRLALDGYVVVLADTAGLRDTADPIEREGVRRARVRAEDADLRIFVVDTLDSESRTRVGLETECLGRPGDIVFFNKADLAPRSPATPQTDERLIEVAGSALGGDVEGLLDELRRRVGAMKGESVLITRERHRAALSVAHAAVVRAQAVSGDLAAEDVRVALQSLARIVGRFDVEAVLDRIFSAFCIGK
ncbi:tRNA modification GTPase MnmE [Alphaproteobacteria bacterium SO-S41]|nr:tRNA modification GTPase MnmE [Alphaproteobacteria bacterium SO-S41]